MYSFRKSRILALLIRTTLACLAFALIADSRAFAHNTCGLTKPGIMQKSFDNAEEIAVVYFLKVKKIPAMQPDAIARAYNYIKFWSETPSYPVFFEYKLLSRIKGNTPEYFVVQKDNDWIEPNSGGPQLVFLNSIKQTYLGKNTGLREISCSLKFFEVSNSYPTEAEHFFNFARKYVSAEKLQ